MLDKFFKSIEKIIPSKWHWILSHDGFRRYFSNTGWMFFGQMFSLITSFFIGAWLARYLGPSNYGIFNYALAFAGLFSFIAPLGIDSILSRDLVAHPEKSNELMGTTFVLKLVGGFLAFFLASLSAYFLETSYLVKIIVVIFSLSFLFYSFQIFSIFFGSIVQSKKNVKSQLIATIIASILKIILILGNFGIIWLAVILLIEIIIQSFGYYFSYKKSNFSIKNWKFDKNLAISILNKSWLLMFASAAVFIYLKIDQVIIGKMMSSVDVGLYAAAVKLADIWYFVPGIICSSLFPAIINAKKNSENLYKKRLKNLYILMFLLSVLVAIPVSLLSKPLIYWIFGQDYIGASGVLGIYVWAGIGIFLGMAINQYLMSENMLRTIFVLNLLTMIINIVLNILFIPILGINGAALATLISYLIIPVLIFSFDKFFKEKIK